ncbi:hypothetical protein Sjap_007395 [Stephania japonica]|uniref:Protein kinase domain-containing protein n=1 Tax=Stephania japonica TaxID=461633 RepID=A0AAP0JNH0_9MAGN
MIDGFSLGIKMMMDQLIRGPGFMPPPQARPPMALNLTDPSPNSSKKQGSFPGLMDHLSWHRCTMDKKWFVKVGFATSTQGTREFENELNLLSAIRHENLVPLLGYYCENDQQILVYPFMSNGSLQDCLYGEASKKKVLDWPTRISIALGLFYLHTFAGRGVIHRDVKSSNILLDHSMYAKVAENCRKTENWKTEKLSFVDWFHEMCSYQFVVLLIGCRTLRIS